MSENTSINWQENFLGVAYRFFDVRMNIALMFPERKEASSLWLETVHWWNDHTIKVRFVEIGDEYWFIAGADSRKPSTNKSFYKILPKSENYERFKKGHNGSAILRFAVYTKKFYDGRFRKHIPQWGQITFVKFCATREDQADAVQRQRKVSFSLR